MSARSRARSVKYGASRAIGGAANKLDVQFTNDLPMSPNNNDGMEVALPALP